MNPDEKSLFLDAMEDVQPLKRCADVHWHPSRNARAPQRVDILQLDNFLTTGFLDVVPLATPLEFRREGVQTGVIDKLRSGKYSQQASLSLLRQPLAKKIAQHDARFLISRPLLPDNIQATGGSGNNIPGVLCWRQ